jgi:lipopolysaccharide transport protein LptA
MKTPHLFMLFIAAWFFSLQAEPTNSIATSSEPANTTKAKDTTITSDGLEFDYKKKIGTFEGNVIAIDPQMTLKCKKMLVYFGDNNNEVVRLEAFHDVHLYQGSEEATGDKAVFTRDTGIVVISGTKPKLRNKDGMTLVSMGEGIIYNVHTKVLKADKASMEIPSKSGEGFLSPIGGK